MFLASPLGEQIGEDQNIAAKFHCDQSYFQRPIQAGCSIRDALNQFNLESDRHRILYMGIELCNEIFEKHQTSLFLFKKATSVGKLGVF